MSRAPDNRPEVGFGSPRCEEVVTLKAQRYAAPLSFSPELCWWLLAFRVGPERNRPMIVKA